MNEKELQEIVLRVVLTELAKAGEPFVPATSSNRHVHLSQTDVERLFGEGYRLTKLRDLVQPGQYACEETVVLEGEKGKTTLRVVGPARKETQVELSYTDCFKLGIRPVLRMSGETQGTAGCSLSHGEKRITLPQGVMVAKRHLHMSPEEATAYGLKDGDVVTLQAEGERSLKLENMVVRSGEGHRLEAHIDKDEANACGITDGQLCRILLVNHESQRVFPQVNSPATLPALTTFPAPTLPPPLPQERASLSPYFQAQVEESKTKLLDLSHDPHCLIAEEDVLSAIRNGFKLIRYRKGAVLTPLARDVASAKGVEWIELD